MKMAASPIKFTCLLLFLLFISAWFSSTVNAHPTVEVDNSSSERIAVDGEGMVTTSIEMIGGRKALGAHSMKRPDIKGNAAPGGTASSANDRVVGKYGYEREVMDIGNKRNGSRFSEGMKESSGFVAFNADYHEPRHHPPKNN